jgi:hypothetical protein
LIGHTVEVRQAPATIEVRYSGELVETMPRVRGRDHRIDYRHVIRSLVRKPGAFARYRYREELFPTLPFRQAYDALLAWHGDRADVEYVRLLHLAASGSEGAVAQTLTSLLADRRPFDYHVVQQLIAPATPRHPMLRLPEPDLTVYDTLLAGGRP